MSRPGGTAASTPGRMPTAIKKQGNRSLQITWDDGHVSQYGFRYLRQHCVCAACVEEWTGRPLLDREGVAFDLEGQAVRAIGNYALGFSFSDPHDSGIYHFDHLRAICPCASCGAARNAT